MHPRVPANWPGNSGTPEAATGFDLDAGPGGVVGRLEAWRLRETAEAIGHLPGHGEPSGNGGVDSVVEPYEFQRFHAAIRWDRGCAQGAATSGDNGGGQALASPSRTTACW